MGGDRPVSAASGRGLSRASSQWAGPIPREQPMGGLGRRRADERRVWPRGPRLLLEGPR